LFCDYLVVRIHIFVSRTQSQEPYKETAAPRLTVARLVTATPPETVGVMVMVLVVRPKQEQAVWIWPGCALGPTMVGVATTEAATV